MVCKVFQSTVFFLVVVCVGTLSMRHCYTVCSISVLKLVQYTDSVTRSHIFSMPCDCCVTALESTSANIRYIHSFAFHGNTISHHKFVPYWPVPFCSRLHLIFSMWPPCNYVIREHLQFCVCFLLILYPLSMCILGDYCCANCMYVYIHICDFLVPVLCMDIMG